MRIKKLSLTCIVMLSLIFISSCSKTDNPTNKVIRNNIDRTSGYKAPDGTFVGPRGRVNKDLTPKDIGPYGKRKKIKGNLTIEEDSATYKNIDVDGVIFVKADNVTISNFTAQRVTQDPGNTGMLLEDGKIDGQNKKNDGIQWSNFTVRRTEITRTFDGIKAMGDVVIQDNYIHDLDAFNSKDAGEGGYSHNDCVQISAKSNILIERNWFNNCGYNSAIFVDPDQAPISNVTIQHNYLNGGGITLYVIASRRVDNGVPSKVTVSNNVFGINHEFDFAAVGKDVVFIDNVTINNEVIKARYDDDES
ncbi:MAG: right-handed parallel beta-helix repeat-containing protein [Acidimicrobiia bacterium]